MITRAMKCKGQTSNRRSIPLFPTLTMMGVMMMTTTAAAMVTAAVVTAVTVVMVVVTAVRVAATETRETTRICP